MLLTWVYWIDPKISNTCKNSEYLKGHICHIEVWSDNSAILKLQRTEIQHPFQDQDCTPALCPNSNDIQWNYALDGITKADIFKL